MTKTQAYGYRADGTFDGPSYAIACSLVAMGQAIKARPLCGAPGMQCGGTCGRPAGHAGPCYCEGLDEDGEETCPA